ncbi:MAG: hypothetical protein MJ144_03120 [Clostridia bacterium]|nr:hypothetical protein [Clostridia bacterium]
MAKISYMTEYIKLVFSNHSTSLRGGFYTVEAAIFLPLVVLAVLTLGYFLKIDSAWETSMHEALNKCNCAAAIGVTGLHTKDIHETVNLTMPAEFSHSADIKGRILYRDFIGKKYNANGMGAEGLETDTDSTKVWIFPQSGTKYHRENCTYVKATVHSCLLTASVKRHYSPCGLCHSEKIPAGSIVFCFYGDDTSYHYGNCRSIKRHTTVIDKGEAESRGYTPCSKCGGA